MKIDPASLDPASRHDLLMSLIVPRPIAFVSTIGENGMFNLAPFSTFTSLASKPALVCFSVGWRLSDGLKKYTLKNIEFSKDFVINVVTEELAEAMNQASAEFTGMIDKFKAVGLTPQKSDVVKSPMIAESPVNMECKLLQLLEFGEAPEGNNVIVGQIMLVHIKDDLWTGNYVEPRKLKAIARTGGERDYCRTTDIFKMKRP
jgi:flavin reductase (DIM6/NTAB) family NADH-FMN oxidoreductase RutF